LNQDALAALLASAQDGGAGAPALDDGGGFGRSGDGRAGGSVRPLDFRRPRQFTNDAQRRLRRALDTFCRTASSRLSAELRTPVDLEVGAVEQLTWSDAHGQIPGSALTAVLTAEPINTRMLLSAEQPLLVAAIERMLGGSGDFVPPERRLSDIDTMLAGQLFEALVDQLSVIWNESLGATLTMAGVGLPQQTAQLAPTSEPTLGFRIEGHLFGASVALLLLLPYRAIAPVLDRLTALEGYDPAADSGAADAMDRGLRKVTMELRAEIGAVDLPIDQVLSMQPGDLIALNRHAGAGVTLFVGDTALERGRPGRSGARRAVQVLGPGERAQ
ncbi:MAG TPA: FliM/FliN family flagellar motor switch protein, partial [Solirubrobacteraceae bacterium]